MKVLNTSQGNTAKDFLDAKCFFFFCFCFCFCFVCLFFLSMAGLTGLRKNKQEANWGNRTLHH